MPGRLRYRVAFDKREDVNPDVPKDYGNTRSEFVEQFVTYADIVPKFGGESVTAARLAGRQPVVIKIRQFAAARLVRPDWRARDARSGRIYNIRSLSDQQGSGWIEILADDQGEVAP